MHIEKGKGSVLRLIMGILTLASVALGFTVNKNFFYFTGFIGFMQILSYLTGFCPMEIMLRAMGVEQKNGCCS